MQENCIDLVGRIADRGAEYVPAREWMRICFELLEMLKAHKKGIRRATVNTFGYIAKAIGPQDVLVTLLNNLKVQERQNRVCTTVAIAIVAETCSPFTVLPALMNEYKVRYTCTVSLAVMTFVTSRLTASVIKACINLTSDIMLIPMMAEGYCSRLGLEINQDLLSVWNLTKKEQTQSRL